MATAFFSPDVASDIQQEDNDINVKESLKCENVDVEEVFEIKRCSDWIAAGKYQRVAIQLPDELLCVSAKIVQHLEQTSIAKYFILGDTSYGSCCVDEVAAQHNSADCIIHFGRACLSRTKRLPVLYVFGRKPVSRDECVEQFVTLFPEKSSKIIVMFDTYYQYAVADIYSALKESYPNLLLSRLLTPESLTTISSSTISRCNRTVVLPQTENLDHYSVFYIGGEGLTLTNLMMNYTHCPFFTFDPETHVGRRETLNVNKALMKRYYMVERIKDADIVGIVAGTLGVADYLEMINRLKSLIKSAGKKSYTFVVGKLNVAKLANFMEIDVFVLVSCPENTLIDSSEFYKPVVTPFEVEIALNSDREWTGDYVTDFQELLPGAKHFVEIAESNDSDVTDVSLISNKMRTLRPQDDDIVVVNSAVVSRDQNLNIAVKAQTASEFLDSRSWKGLDRNPDNTSVTKATEGRSGIAASYENEASGS